MEDINVMIDTNRVEDLSTSSTHTVGITLANMDESRRGNKGEEDCYMDNECVSEPVLGSQVEFGSGAGKPSVAMEEREPGQSSPTTSAVSVSSVPPSLIATLLQKQDASFGGSHLPFQLTPVICNTSFATATISVGPSAGSAAQTAVNATRGRPSVVSPLDGKQLQEEPNLEEFSQGNSSNYGHDDGHLAPSLLVVECTETDKEHLSLPTDLADGDANCRGPCISPSGGAFPPLRITTTDGGRLQNLSVRPSNSNTSVLLAPIPTRASSGDLHPPPLQFQHSLDTEKRALHNAIAFPTHKKFNSFTNVQQYEGRLNRSVAVEFASDLSEGHYYGGGDEIEEEDEDDVLGRFVPNYHHPQHLGLTPYQPKRPEDAMLEVPPEEELSQIFAARARFFENRTASEGSNPSLGEKHHRLSSTSPYHSFVSTTTSAVAGGAASALQTQGIDQYPSLHLARRLSTATMTDNASVTTHTTLNTWGEEDDSEDFLNNSSSGQTSWSNSWQQNFPVGNVGFANSINGDQQPPLLEDPEAEAAVSPQRQRNHSRKQSSSELSHVSVVVEGFEGSEWAQQTPRRGGDGSLAAHRFRSFSGEIRNYGSTNTSTGASGEGGSTEADSSVIDQQSIDNDTTMAVDGRYIKEQEALEWIQSLQVSSLDTSTTIAEAASSKFLCGTSGTPVHSPNRKRAAPPLLHSSRTGSQPFLS